MAMKEESPDALAGAAGAKNRRSGKADDATNGARRQARDPYAEARDMFIMRVVAEPRATEAAVKIAVAMAVGHVNRIAFERNETLTAWPSMRTIAFKLGMFRGRVARALALLEEIGLITIVRPDKRGATHHNRYVLHHVARLLDQETGDGIGLTTVANSGEKNGLIVEDNIEAEKGAIGLSGEDAMASPVGPKSIEEPPEGAGALSARPALTTDQGCSSDIEEDHLMETDAKTECGSGAVDPPLATSPDASDPDAWRSEVDFNSDTRLVQHAGRAPEGAPGVSATTDLDGEGAHWVRAEEALGEIYGDHDVDAFQHLSDAIDGLSDGNQKATIRFHRDMTAMLSAVHPTRRREIFERHCDVIEGLLTAVAGGRKHAQTVVAGLVRDRQKMEARHG
jgi:hypothetical protein